MTARATTLILNPTAGRGGAERRLESLRNWLEGWAPGWRLRRTEGPGHALELARTAAAEGSEMVIAAGGDGTVNEVVNGLLGSPVAPPRLAVLPLGTGCDFARGLGLPARPRRLREVSPSWRRIDVALATRAGERRYFVNAANVGVGAVVAERLAASRAARRLGRVAYLYVGVPAVRAARALPVRIEIDGVVGSDDLVNVVVCNGPFLGGGMSPCPSARLDDGKLDVACVTPLEPRMIGRLAWSVLRSRPLRSPAIRVEQGRCIRIRGRAGVELDGDPWGELPVDFGVEPAALEVMAAASD